MPGYSMTPPTNAVTVHVDFQVSGNPTTQEFARRCRGATMWIQVSG